MFTVLYISPRQSVASICWFKVVNSKPLILKCIYDSGKPKCANQIIYWRFKLIYPINPHFCLPSVKYYRTDVIVIILYLSETPLDVRSGDTVFAVYSYVAETDEAINLVEGERLYILGLYFSYLISPLNPRMIHEYLELSS